MRFTFVHESPPPHEDRGVRVLPHADRNYCVTVIDVTPLVLVDDNVTNPRGCIEGIAVIDGSARRGAASFPFNFPNRATRPEPDVRHPATTKLVEGQRPGLIADSVVHVSARMRSGRLSV